MLERSRSKLFLPILVAACGLLLTGGLLNTEGGQRLELYFYDLTVQWRSAQSRSPSVDPRIVILAIDEKSRQEVADPLALWLPIYGQIIDGVFSSEALALGIDVIPTYAPRELLLPFAKPALEHKDKIVMVSYQDQETNTLVEPAPAIRAILGDERLALSNVVISEIDNVARRQFLAQSAIGEKVRPFFAPFLYQIVTEKGALPKEVLVNFVGPPNTFPRYSVSEVLQWIEAGDKRSLQAAFEGKIILLGGTARADQDFLKTPFPVEMAGIEFHANTLNTLLRKNFLKESRLFPLFTLLLLPLAWLALEKPLKVSLPAAGLFCAIWLGGIYYAFLSGQVVTPSLTAVAGFLTTASVGYLYRFNTVEKDRRRIRSVFGRYVSKDVMEAMLQVPDDHRPELAVTRRVTVMFSDINDFSTACETLEPEEVTRRLNLYFNEMTPIIYRYRGTIIRFIGDEFMVLFGAPAKDDRSEEMAVLAGVEMVERLRELRAGDPNEENGFYHVKIGIHVGDMILTSIGNELRSDYNCIGDSTNMAARILSLTKPLDATVLVSEDVKRRVEHRKDIGFLDKGVHPVKGRAGEVHVYDAELLKSV